MLILIVAAGFVFPGIAKIAATLDDTVYYGDASDGLLENRQEIISNYEKQENLDSDQVLMLEESKLIVKYGIDSTYDWRYLILSETLSASVAVCFDDELYEKLLEEKLAKIDQSLPEDEINVLMNSAIASAEAETTKAAIETAKQLPTFAEITKAIESGDVNLYYDIQIKAFETGKALMTSDAEKAVAQAQIDHFTFLKENNIPYFSDLMRDDVAYFAADFYNARYFDSYELMRGKMAVISYENDIGNISKGEYEKAKDVIALRKYMLENDIEYNAADSIDITNSVTVDFWSAMSMSASAVSFVGLLIIVLSALSIANEFSNGTIKFLLINPVKRWKILVSKYFTIISMAYIMLIILYIFSTIASVLFFGTSQISQCVYEVVDGEVVVTAGMLEIFKSYLIGSIEVVVMATLAFAISALMRSSAFAIGISMLCMFGGNVAIQILSAMKLDWARYLIFANLDLEMISNGTSPFAYQTISGAVGVIIVHMVIFWLIAWDAFTKKDL